MVYSLRALILVKRDLQKIETNGRPEYVSEPSLGVWFVHKEPHILDWYRPMERRPIYGNLIKRFDVQKKPISHQSLETEDNR